MVHLKNSEEFDVAGAEWLGGEEWGEAEDLEYSIWMGAVGSDVVCSSEDSLSELGALGGVEPRSDMIRLELCKSHSSYHIRAGAKSRTLESLGSPYGPL